MGNFTEKELLREDAERVKKSVQKMQESDKKRRKTKEEKEGFG